jgi:hypothetical protein
MTKGLRLMPAVCPARQSGASRQPLTLIVPDRLKHDT